MTQCLPNLHRQIELVNPDLVLCFGRVAAQALLEDTGKVRTTGKRPAALYRLRYRDRPAFFPRTFSPRD